MAQLDFRRVVASFFRLILTLDFRFRDGMLGQIISHQRIAVYLAAALRKLSFHQRVPLQFLFPSFLADQFFTSERFISYCPTLLCVRDSTAFKQIHKFLLILG